MKKLWLYLIYLILAFSLYFIVDALNWDRKVFLFGFIILLFSKWLIEKVYFESDTKKEDEDKTK